MSIASEGAKTTESLNGKLTFEQDKNRIVGRDGDNLARLLVLANGNDFVMKVAAEGSDVLTAPDSELIFNSNNNLFKIVDSDIASFAVGSLNAGDETTHTVAHGQTGIPAIIAFVNGTGSSFLTANRHYSVPTTIPVSVGGVYQAGIVYRFEVDSTNIYFKVSNYTSLSPVTNIGTANFKYFVLQETVA